MLKTYGIHHISSIVGQAQRSLDFYASILGMRLVKQTLNYDNKATHHLYFSNTDGTTPLVTTFPFNDSEAVELSGGQVKTQIFAIPKNTTQFWIDRLNHFNVTVETHDMGLYFKDPDGLRLMLVEKDYDPINPWSFNGIDKDHAIIGLDSASLLSVNYKKTLEMLVNVLGYTVVNEDEENVYLHMHDEIGGTLILLKQNESMGQSDRGTVHHIAFKILDDEAEAWKQHLKSLGYYPTAVKERHYFKAVYFRDKGGQLIELATINPGVTIDEPVAHLGESFIIPEHFEDHKAEIFESIMPLFVREIDAMQSYGYRNRQEYELLMAKEKNRRVIANLLKKQKVDGLSEHESKLLEIEKAKYMRRVKEYDTKS